MPKRLVWENQVGGRTYELTDGAGRRFRKESPPAAGIDLRAEAERLRWAAPRHPFPRVLAEGPGWLLTAGLPGDNAIQPRWVADPAPAVAAIGRGLRTMHDGLPVAECPFGWRTEERVADAHRRADALDPGDWHDVHKGLSVVDALARVDEMPPVDRLVVCHGDACAPNTLLTDDGAWSGHVDAGALGVGDRWADLAVATWSTEWNYGPGWERPLLDAYGVDPDPERTAYYRLLWDLGP